MISSSILIKAEDLKWNPLEDGAMDDILPAQWDGSHASKRMVEAFTTLSAMPGTGVGSSRGCWPAYCYEWHDLLAQQEQEADEKAQNQREQNRSRIMPSADEVTRMEAALYWPARFISGTSYLLRAVNAVCMARAIGRDAEWVARKRGGRLRDWQHRHWEGCKIIAAGLIIAREPVF